MIFQLEDLLNKFIPRSQSWKINLFKEWNSLLGSLADNVRIEAIKGSALIVGVPHSTWAHELTFFSDMLLEKINRHIGTTKIETLRFKVVSFSKNKKPSLNSHNHRSFSLQNHKKLTLSSREEVCLKKIKNAELKEALRGYYSYCKTH